ncbi:hypothetical protein [Paractinoplanes durhamensis]|uniref:Uncharacterized protein n=1 Tax=Paractinoplanes durhamensis TaxID=113563 RepID=A0ABQ3ZCN6_9ACTN|nr:hypothetical protein [Actinoplanes durhamensis]GIE07304.1 hypothetical protein Adu01nite_86540 [Actinoplanes durhamensis]
MRAEAQRTYLGMLMWGYLEEFARDVDTNGIKDAFTRFISWTR